MLPGIFGQPRWRQSCTADRHPTRRQKAAMAEESEGRRELCVQWQLLTLQRARPAPAQAHEGEGPAQAREAGEAQVQPEGWSEGAPYQADAAGTRE